jgi:heme-degrading monooxygenase HmoA
MVISISIHHPRPGKEELLIDSMHRYGAAARTQAGLVEVHTLKDARTGTLVGLAVWESEAAKNAAQTALWEAVKDDDFDDWESEPISGYLLEEV